MEWKDSRGGSGTNVTAHRINCQSRPSHVPGQQRKCRRVRVRKYEDSVSERIDTSPPVWCFKSHDAVRLSHIDLVPATKVPSLPRQRLHLCLRHKFHLTFPPDKAHSQFDPYAESSRSSARFARASDPLLYERGTHQNCTRIRFAFSISMIL